MVFTFLYLLESFASRFLIRPANPNRRICLLANPGGEFCDGRKAEQLFKAVEIFRQFLFRQDRMDVLVTRRANPYYPIQFFLGEALTPLLAFVRGARNQVMLGQKSYFSPTHFAALCLVHTTQS